MNKHRSLLGINIFEIDSVFLYEQRNSRFNSESIFKNIPKYTFGNNGNVIDAKYYLQFIGLTKEEENKKFTLFEVQTLDDNMFYEIENLGEENFLNEISTYLKEVIKKLPKTSVEEFQKHCFNKTSYLVVDILYKSSGPYGIDDDLEITYDLVGYLDSEMKIIEL